MVTPRTHRKGPRKWRESFTVFIEFIGERWSIGPLLDYIAGAHSNGGGSMLVGPPLCDQDWVFPVNPGLGNSSGQLRAREDAIEVFETLKGISRNHRWSPYIRLRLLHDDKPDRITPMIQVRPGVYKNPPKSSGPLVIRKYVYGKLPKVKVRKLRKRKR